MLPLMHVFQRYIHNNNIILRHEHPVHQHPHLHVIIVVSTGIPLHHFSVRPNGANSSPKFDHLSFYRRSLIFDFEPHLRRSRYNNCNIR
jgi:hypothetical protein